MGYTIWPDGTTGDVVREVYEERGRQDAKWGQQEHEPERYFSILAEEFGEVAKEVVEFHSPGVDKVERLRNMREELIQTAAVAVAMVECLDRHSGVDLHK